MLTFNDLKKLSKIQVDYNTRAVKIALVADFSSQFLHQALRGMGNFYKTDYKIWEADFDQIERQVFDPTSELYMFDPDYVIILRSSENLLHQFYKVTTARQISFATEEIEKVEELVTQLSQKLNARVIINNYFELSDAVFGNYASKVEASFLYQVRKLNFELMKVAQNAKNLFLLDLVSIIGTVGYENAFDAKLYVTADLVYSFNILPDISYHLHGIIQAVEGRFKKCIVVDLDNTLWGGIIGDDGMKGIRIGDLQDGWAYTELQLWIKQLKNRGIIVAVCSKNTESIAKEPFESHPDMKLRLEDIALFVANWENKVDNIRYIQSVLQIGFDSMVFLDDNPFERNMVKEGIPELTVPELPEDPSEYVNYLRSLNLFETASYTEEDSIRTKQYQEEAARVVFQKTFEDETEFLNSLNMVSEVAAFDEFSIPRVAQLTQRSNQFNLRTIRYTEEDINKIAGSSEFVTLSFTLEDKFGDHGLICVVILKIVDTRSLFIDTWIMSCRVLKRGMEKFVLECIIDEARERGFSTLIGEYLPTLKNGIVKNHYKDLGFIAVQDRWELDLTNIEGKKTLITKKKLNEHV